MNRKKVSLPYFAVALLAMMVVVVTISRVVKVAPHLGGPATFVPSQITLAAASSPTTQVMLTVGSSTAVSTFLHVTDTPLATATLLPSPTPLPSYAQQTIAFPIRGAFYYPWFPEAWNQQGFNPFTRYTPLLGYYTSSDLNIIKKHVDEMQYGNISLGIASWWGQGTATDKRVDTLLSAAQNTGFHWALYYEPEGIGNPSPDQITSDLVYIRDHYTANPAYLKIDGRYVIFVYAEPGDDCSMATRWKQANSTINAYVMLKVLPRFASCADQPDGWHQYAAAHATFDRSISFTISPGFWKQGEPAARLPRDLNQWNADIQAMIKSNAKFQLITTFNEWGEGTAIEPAQEWASPSGYGVYLDALHNALSQPSPDAAHLAGTPAP